MANDDCIRSDVDETHHDTTTTTTQTAIPIAAISPNPDPIQCRSQDIMGSDGDDDDDNENENDNDNENENHAKQPPQPRTLRRRRSVCRRCHRPAPSTCICEALPSQPVTLRQCAHIFVLQHPHETRRKNCSLPLIQLCLAPPHADQVVKLRYDEDDNASTPTEEKEYQNNSNNKNNTCLTVVQGRMLSPSHPDVQRCFWPKVDHTNTNNNRNVVWLLSPGGNAISLTRALDEWRLITSQSDSTPPPMLTLLFLDATWRVRVYMRKSNHSLLARTAE